MGTNEYKAEMVDGVLVVKPKIIKKTNKDGGTDVTICMPSLPVITKAMEDFKNG